MQIGGGIESQQLARPVMSDSPAWSSCLGFRGGLQRLSIDTLTA